MEKLMKSGDFASLCRSTKNTLIHYDEIGLLKPAFVGENGYRYYSAEQFFDMSMISTLQQAGVPLAKIQELRESDSPGQVLQTLTEKVEALRRKAQTLLSEATLYSAFLDLARQTLAAPHGKLLFEDRQEETVRLFPAPSAWTASAEGMAEGHRHCIAWDMEHEDYVAPPSGMMIAQKDLQQGRLTPSAFFTRSVEGHGKSSRGGTDAEGRMVWTPKVFPKGRYAVLYVKDTVDEEKQALKEFLADLKGQGYTLEGDLWIADEAGYLLGRPGEASYETKFLIRVRG